MQISSKFSGCIQSCWFGRWSKKVQKLHLYLCRRSFLSAPLILRKLYFVSQKRRLVLSLLDLLDLSASFQTFKQTLSSPPSWVMEFMAQHGHALLLTRKMVISGDMEGSTSSPLHLPLYIHTLSCEVISLHEFSYLYYVSQLILSSLRHSWSSACLADISSVMAAHQLKLSPIYFHINIHTYRERERDASLCEDLVIWLGNIQITPCESACSRGVALDNHSSLTSLTSLRLWFLLYNIGSTWPFLSTGATQVLVLSHVILKLDYCNLLLAGLHFHVKRPLQLIHNAAATLFSTSPSSPTSFHCFNIKSTGFL